MQDKVTQLKDDKIDISSAELALMIELLQGAAFKLPTAETAANLFKKLAAVSNSRQAAGAG